METLARYLGIPLVLALVALVQVVPSNLLAKITPEIAKQMKEAFKDVDFGELPEGMPTATGVIETWPVSSENVPPQHNVGCEWSELQLYRGSIFLPTEMVMNPHRLMEGNFDPAILTACGIEQASWNWLLNITRYYFGPRQLGWKPHMSNYEGTEQAMHDRYVWGLLGSAPTSMRGHVLRRAVLPAIYANPQLLERIYAWAGPVFIADFKSFPPEQQQFYLRALRHAKTYLASYDNQRELQYMADLRRGMRCDPAQFKQYAEPMGYDWHMRHKCERVPEDDWSNTCLHKCEDQFPRIQPDGTPHPLRQLEAFIYRRHNNDGVPIALMQHWVDVFIRDFGNVAKHN